MLWCETDKKSGLVVTVLSSTCSRGASVYFLIMRRPIRPLTILIFLVLCLNADAAISLVAHKTNKDVSGGEITALSTVGYTSTAGNLIAVWTVSYRGAQPVGSVTDSAGDTFTAATQRTGRWYGQWFYAKNVKGDPFNVVTIHSGLAGRATLIYVGMTVLEYSGLDKTSPLDVDTAGTQGSLAGAWTSGAFSAPAGEVVLLGITTAPGSAYTAGAGFTIEESYITPANAAFSFAAQDQILSAAQTGGTASITWTGSYQATGAVVSFKAAARSQ